MDFQNYPLKTGEIVNQTVPAWHREPVAAGVWA